MKLSKPICHKAEKIKCVAKTATTKSVIEKISKKQYRSIVGNIEKARLQVYEISQNRIYSPKIQRLCLSINEKLDNLEISINRKLL